MDGRVVAYQSLVDLPLNRSWSSQLSCLGSGIPFLAKGTYSYLFIPSFGLSTFQEIHTLYERSKKWSLGQSKPAHSITIHNWEKLV